ncbi:DUF3800 domain-containing protein [Loktanella sp. F6476L]|uniref:DUF3800 domain-containing protein n=1 Tax=Loktanella sp. F6476L TaxID=2926405 RepID=UPI001FF59E57|nr:DUF3800 domain-containing protein [Loktanella sp. F6476L]MCK0120106.1 DUF3800 domain-containing protein [Loktanella sp. F6476L]
MYRLYLDEVGTDDLSHLENDNHRFLSLSGVIVELAHVEGFLNPAIRQLKHSVFEFDPDDVVHLHRSDIVKRKSVFGQLNDNKKRELFDGLVLNLVQNTEFRLITVVIDKLEMTRQHHWEQKHPYHYLMEIMVEKFVQFLERVDDIGDIMPEARQGKKDRKLQEVFSDAKQNGTRFLNGERGVERIHSRIRGSQLKFRTKKDNISGLQLCDLVAHPSHMYIRSQKRHDVRLGAFAESILPVLIDVKYDRSAWGRVDGYGTKYCP